MEQVQVNKYVRLGLTILTGALGLLAAYNWSDLVDTKTAGLIVVAISAVKAIIDVLAPGAGVATQPTGTSTSLITHKSVP
jgi:glycine cleavage system H lipoate-binding protein